MLKDVIIIGAGGHGKVVADIIKLNGDNVVGFLDDKPANLLPHFNVLGKVSDVEKYQDCYVFIAIGNNAIRASIDRQYDLNLYTAIHPSAVVAADTKIADGCVIMANAVLNSGSMLGRCGILNTAATVDHDCNIGAYAHISPGVHVAGTVNVCHGTWLGIGSIISNNVNIKGGNLENNIMVGAGSVVIKDIEKPGTYFGAPAKLIMSK